MASRYALCALNGPTTTHTSLATHGTTLLNVCLRLNCPSISETSGSHTASSNCPGAMATKWGAHEMSKSNSVKQSCTSTHGNQHEGFSKVPGALKNSPSHATLRSVMTCFFVFFDEGDEEDDQNDLCARCSWSPSPPLSSSPVLSTSIATIPSPSSFAAAAAGKFPDRNRIKTSTSLPSSFFFVLSVLLSFISSSSSPASSIAASGSSSPPFELKSISSPLSSSTRTIEAPAPANLLLMREAAPALPVLPILPPPPPVFIVIKLSSSTCFMSLILSTMESSKNAFAAAFVVVFVVVVVKFVSSSSSTKIRLHLPFCPSISIESISTKSFSA